MKKTEYYCIVKERQTELWVNKWTVQFLAEAITENCIRYRNVNIYRKNMIEYETKISFYNEYSCTNYKALPASKHHTMNLYDVEAKLHVF
jgi:hypothetical protein